MLNDDKTEFIVIASTRHPLKKAAVNTIWVGDCDVSKISVVRILGAWFDDQLTMAVHITKICSAAFYHLHNIRRIRKYPSVDAAATLIHSYVSSRIDYCNSLLYGVPKCHFDKWKESSKCSRQAFRYAGQIMLRRFRRFHRFRGSTVCSSID